MTENDTLSTKQYRFLEALQVTGGVAEAALAAGVGRKTAYRWLRQPAFMARLRAQQDAVLHLVTYDAVQHMGAALAVLATIMADVTKPASARVSAAKAILESGLRFAELVDLAERVALLEQKLGGEHAN